MEKEIVELQVAVLDYGKDSRVLRMAMNEIELMIHSKDEFTIGDPDYTFGWYFFPVYVKKSMIIKLVNMLGNEFLKVKGNGIEKKFVNWLSARMKRVGCNIHINLRSELDSSKYGLF